MPTSPSALLPDESVTLNPDEKTSALCKDSSKLPYRALGIFSVNLSGALCLNVFSTDWSMVNAVKCESSIRAMPLFTFS